MQKEGEFVADLLAGRLLVEQNEAEAVQQAQAPVVLHIASLCVLLARSSKLKFR